MSLVEILRDSVRRSLSNALAPCATLSGGLDSSTVVALAPDDLPCYTGYYDFLDAWDERRYAKLVAKRDWRTVKITPEDLVEHFDDFAASVGHLEDPCGIGAFGQFMVARRIADDGHDVVLSGEGSDELFGGYVRASRLSPDYTVPDEYRNYVPPDGYPDELEAALRWDLARLPTLLAVDDAVLGYFELEGRTPFTDIRVVAHALSLPASERVNKRHLRDAVRGIVPDAIVERTDKMGFPAPFALWAKVEPVRSFVLERIGYLPDRAVPHARGWWHEMIRESAG